MNRTHLAFAVLCIALTLLTACSRKDGVINVAENDPEMVAAIIKARETLPEFWSVFEKPERGESGFALKVEITDENGTEHFWVTSIERRDGTLTGLINNDPNVVESVEFGERIQISDADISDWMYMRDGKMVGNETLKPLLKSIPASEAERLRDMMTNA